MENRDYIVSCKNNKAITSGSDATLTITGKKNYKGKGIGDYGGVKSVNFTIGTRKIFWWIF